MVLGLGSGFGMRNGSAEQHQGSGFVVWDAESLLRIKGLADQNHGLGFRGLRVGVMVAGKAAGRSET